MSIAELASYIRQNKKGLDYPGVHPSEDLSVVLQYTRHEMITDVHITDQHVLECCEKARSFEEHVKLCRPLAQADTEAFNYWKNRPVTKGRTRRRFK